MRRCDYCAGEAVYSIRLAGGITYWFCHGDANLAVDAIVPFEGDRESEAVIMRWEK